MGLIHKTALVSPTAQLHPTVEVGAYSIIGDHVCIDAGTRVGPHCVIDGHTNIGKNNEFYRFCSIGGIPQDKKYAGVPTRLEIGDDNTVRAYVTINTGTVQDIGVTRIANDNTTMAYVEIAYDTTVRVYRTINTGAVKEIGVTRIGDDNWIMAYVRTAHDCEVGSDTMIATSVQLAGHIRVGDWALLGGLSAVPQFVRIG